MKFATIFTSIFEQVSAESLKKEAEAKQFSVKIKSIKANLDTLESEEPFSEIKLAA